MAELLVSSDATFEEASIFSAFICKITFLQLFAVFMALLGIISNNFVTGVIAEPYPALQ